MITTALYLEILSLVLRIHKNQASQGSPVSVVLQPLCQSDPFQIYILPTRL